jgi:hypothetical protein
VWGAAADALVITFAIIDRLLRARLSTDYPQVTIIDPGFFWFIVYLVNTAADAKSAPLEMGATIHPFSNADNFPRLIDVEQLNRIAESLRSVTLLAASEAADAVHQLEALGGLEKDWNLRCYDGKGQASRFVEELDQLRAALGKQILIVPPMALWTRRWIDRALERTRRLSPARRGLSVVFVCDPSQTFELMSDRGGFASLNGLGVELVAFGPASSSQRDKWAAALAGSGIPNDAICAALGFAGGWPALAREAYCAWLSKGHDPDNMSGDELCRLFGIPNSLRPKLQRIAQSVVASATTTTDSLLVGDRHELDTILDWAQILQFIQRKPDGEIEFEPVFLRAIWSEPEFSGPHDESADARSLALADCSNQ